MLLPTLLSLHVLRVHLRQVILFTPFLAFAYYLVAVACAVRFFSRRRALRSDDKPHISILKPVRGVDREAYENFASFCRLDYPKYEILFGVSNPADPVVPIIQNLMRDFPERPIRLFTGMSKQGPNEKSSILAHLAREAQYNLLVISDSDTRVAPDCLHSIAAPFRDPRVGAVTCLYRGEQAVTLADKLEAIGVSTDFFAGVFVAEQFAGTRFALGATMATTRSCLHEIGGFETLSDYLMDDYELGYRLAKQGYRVELLPYSVSIILPAETIRDYWQRQLRWAIGVRNSRPWGHIGLLVTQGLLLTLAAMIVSSSEREAGFYLAAYFITRYAMAISVGILGLKDSALRRRAWLIPLRDALAFCIWIVSIFHNRINWRGDAFCVRKGRLMRIEN